MIFGYFLQLTCQPKDTALLSRETRSDDSAPQPTHLQHLVKESLFAPNYNCKLQTLNSTEAAQATKESCAADSEAGGGRFAVEKHFLSSSHFTLSVKELKGSHQRSSGFVSAFLHNQIQGACQRQFTS